MIGKYSTVCSIVILFVKLQLSECYTYHTVISEHPHHLGKCYSTETKHAYNIGESYQRRTVCEKLTCGNDLRFDAVGCGVVMIDGPECYEINPDLTLPYPKCCEKYECVDENGNKFRA